MATIVPIAPGTGGTAEADGDPDACLVDGLRAGRRDAFEQLYELYRALIYNLALRIVQSPEDARDITQDVFVKVYRRLPGSRPHRPRSSSPGSTASPSTPATTTCARARCTATSTTR